ncbi:CRISPR-associated protein Cas4 [Propionispora hippei]|uniref:CRISPR-associated exonuclease Cas4 n=1 Tax=Propionispora hippei DSM 15287 TaxID=1123003 RepID=A0A1M6KUC8_9FIRM|nr:CRISPR-associated protein Cas4 [Propionispora hippei]SHJ62577.1 CRISPR-associated exonuclease, Cas4 family [Propionispora hippei DSM 15287]
MEVLEFDVTGTHIWYYYCCQREVWLMLHQVNADQDDANMDLGRFLHEMTYARDRSKEITLGNIRLDIVRQEDDGMVVGEVKKSSKYLTSARMQLAFYLLELKERGIAARGELLFPKERKREVVELTAELEQELATATAAIRSLAAEPRPPQAKKIALCRNCAYKEFCWA